MRLVVGCELDCHRLRRPACGGSVDAGLLLHVENHAGYTHLCELLSEAHRNGPKRTKNETASVPVESVAKLAGGLWCTAETSLGREAIETLREAFGERLSLGTHR